MNSCDHDAIYFAGLIDGDGTITIQSQLNPRTGMLGGSTLLILSNTDDAVMSWVCDTFGGSIVQARTLKAHHKPVFTWRIAGRQADEVCARILPYLKIKRRHAEIIIEYGQLRGAATKGATGRYVPPEWYVRRAALIDEIRALNHRGLLVPDL